MNIAQLPERGVLKVAGEDARRFLDGLVTCDMGLVTPAQAGYGALLTPQGKIIADFLVVELAAEDGGGFLIDCPVVLIPDLLRRLTLYKLRAKVTIEDLTEAAAVVASLDGGTIGAEAGVAYADPRLPALGFRAIVDRQELPELAVGSADDYHARRIGLGVPDGGKDFAYGGALPHEALLDQLGGVSFTKGCYVGQEVVSRMEHRGSARTRLVPIVFVEGFRCEWGAPFRVGEKIVGNAGSTAGDRGLAMVRLDKIADGLAAGEPLTAGYVPVRLEKPSFIRFAFPGEPEFGGQAA